VIILVTGLKGSGKDTLADRLVNSNLKGNHYFVRYSFADPIREVCKVVFDWVDEDFTDTIKKETVDPYFGISPRQAMQWIGTEAFQYLIGNEFPLFKETVGRTVWVKKFLKWREKHSYIKNVVIPDWRFPHEQMEIIENSSEKIKFVRVENRRIKPDDVHESERHIPNLSVDVEIRNDYSLEDFYENIDKLF
jgi:hypothetical protein